MWRRKRVSRKEWHQDAQMWSRKRGSREEWGRPGAAERERDAIPFLCG
jgi:hypothetical protein